MKAGNDAKEMARRLRVRMEEGAAARWHTRHCPFTETTYFTRVTTVGRRRSILPFDLSEVAGRKVNKHTV
jgi:hypothetical protein